MIPNQLVEVRISRESKYYESLGYLKTKQGDLLLVSIEHLPKLSKTIVKIVCDDCGVERYRQFRTISGSSDDAKRCRVCSGKRTIHYTSKKKPSRKFGKDNHRWNPNKPAYMSYSNRVRGLTKTTYNKYKEEINPHNFQRTKSGIMSGHQLDHIISIKRGFEEGISPEILAHKSNLRMITWEQNLERRRLDRNINKEQASSKEK